MSHRKNILLILSDQQRLDTIGAYRRLPPPGYGNSHQADICHTPNLDRLAEEGILQIAAGANLRKQMAAGGIPLAKRDRKGMEKATDNPLKEEGGFAIM